MSIQMIGKKIGMTRVFDEKGFAVPVTLLEIGPCTITMICNEKVQIGYQIISPTKISKPLLGYYQKYHLPCFKYTKEYKSTEYTKKDLGTIITTKKIREDKNINISAISIGKGFSGYQKRHKFSRGPMSHGSKNHREPGSIGAGTTPGRVFPGKRMAGRMGHNKVTIKNLKIIRIDHNNNVLIIKGSVPGKKGNIVYINQK
uniref:Large ribosomal subunit protein uL3c n=1 Tax=Polysiphonia sertularioides TaxID=945028 RepID=A0A1Z1M9S3_9FLOR|nr:ribosomal protein L3 [Polysiphonia sertularioides]ARW62525.1 ribosomal protein L3 [Polysiphonia sertularioides]